MVLIDGGPEGYYCGDGSGIGIEIKTKTIKMDKKVTAQWARETAETVLGKKVEAELEECEKKIREAVIENKMTTTIYSFYGQSKTVQELESRGFKVKQHDDQRDGSSLTISW